MRLQILVPLHTYPDGNADNLALHAAATARHLDADVHALVLIADFPRISSHLANMILDVPALIGDAKANAVSVDRRSYGPWKQRWGRLAFRCEPPK